MVQLTFHGAAETVTGSRYLLETDSARVLIDCGLFQGLKELRERNWNRPAFDPAFVDAVVLTHAHIDHIGYLPRLVKLGFRNPIWSTPATADLADILLRDSANTQESDAEYANRKGFSKHHPALPLYGDAEVERTLKLFRTAERNQWFNPAGDVFCRYTEAGHLLGSSSIELEVRRGTKPLRITFSGDVGRYQAPLYHDPAPPPECDYLICESTYGDRDHPPVAILDQLCEVVLDSIRRGGVMVVASFAVGRAQQLIYLLHVLIKQGRIPELPVFIDSPMAATATEVFRKYAGEHDLSEAQLVGPEHVLDAPNVHLARSVQESKRINDETGPAVIIASSGMMTGGRILHHLKKRLPDRRNTVVLGGYMAQGSRGRDLKDAARMIRIHGQDVPVRAHVAEISAISGHAGRSELLRWLKPLPRPVKTFITHGELTGANALAQILRADRGWDVVIPKQGQTFVLESLVNDAELRLLEDLLKSPSYIRADLDLDLLARPELRPIRMQLELLKPEMLMEQLGVRSTIVLFGSARILEQSAAEKRLVEVRVVAEKMPDAAAGRRLIDQAERLLAKSRYYDEAREFARIVSSSCQIEGVCDYVVLTGGGPGIMEAGNRGAADVAAMSVGLNITLPHEQTPNPYITPELCFLFRYFALRKMHFLLRAKALVAYPGGFGTLDELFETLTLRQTGKMQAIPIVLVGREYWERVIDFQFLADEGVISDDDLKLIDYAETPQETWGVIQKFHRLHNR